MYTCVFQPSSYVWQVGRACDLLLCAAANALVARTSRLICIHNARCAFMMAVRLHAGLVALGVGLRL